MRPFWPRSGAIGVSTTIGAPQATQGLVRRASFIFLLLLPLMSDVLIDRCGLRRPAAPLLRSCSPLAEAACLQLAHYYSAGRGMTAMPDGDRAVMRVFTSRRSSRLVYTPFACLVFLAC